MPRDRRILKVVRLALLINTFRAVTSATKLILIETPTNPLLQICDIRKLAELARESGVLLAVDNSMLSPISQQPLKLGADIVIHSATKFLCGHSDVTAGALITNDLAIHNRIAFQQIRRSRPQPIRILATPAQPKNAGTPSRTTK